jgi:hypothetical protein
MDQFNQYDQKMQFYFKHFNALLLPNWMQKWKDA